MGTRLSHDRRPSGMDLAAQRLEMACGQIRAEIGRARTHPRWSGLLGRSPSGRWDPERDGEQGPTLKGLAHDLDDAARGDSGGNALVPAFLLRQAEIAMRLMSGLLTSVSGIERRLRAVERELAVTEARVVGGPKAVDLPVLGDRSSGGLR